MSGFTDEESSPCGSVACSEAHGHLIKHQTDRNGPHLAGRPRSGHLFQKIHDLNGVHVDAIDLRYRTGRVAARSQQPVLSHATGEAVSVVPSSVCALRPRQRGAPGSDLLQRLIK